MKLNTPYRCDYCQRIKEQTNHWWMRSAALAKFVLETWDDATAGHEQAGGLQFEHICSESCAMKALAKWMGEQSKRTPRGVTLLQDGKAESITSEEWAKREGR